MAPDAPACSSIQASIAGSRSTAPLKRRNSVLVFIGHFHCSDSCKRAYPARAKKLERSVVKGRKSSVVGFVALWNKQDHPLPSSRQNYSIRIFEVKSPRFVIYRLPLCPFEGLVDPHTILVVE